MQTEPAARKQSVSMPHQRGHTGKMPTAGGNEASWGARGEQHQDRAKADGTVLDYLCRWQNPRAAFFLDGWVCGL